jgi:L-seryl-tRNA(Ser) seleniumtransferase
MDLKGLPRTDRVLSHPALDDVKKSLGPRATLALVRAAIDAARERLRGGGALATEDDVAEEARADAARWLARRTQRVINATGVVLHTNLGRAPLGDAAVAALAREGGGYVSLEVDLATGKRGGRAAFAERAIALLAGAEAALVVNNNAAAVLLALAALATGKPVLVSRGELVEIGGGFRVPEVLGRSGARLVEVGTTNRTRAGDYAEALEAHPDAAAILRVHPGNFRQVGFVERPSLPELVKLGRERGLAVIEDLGGGALVDLPGLSGDPPVAESVAAGPDLVTFSTDKTLGGPQGGVLVGTLRAVELARKDPLARALRLGRLPLVALEATLAAYLGGDAGAVPAVAMTLRPVSELRERATRWAATLEAAGVKARVIEVASVTGGGTFPGEDLPSVGIALDAPDPDGLLAALRRAESPVLARIADGVVVCDARTVLPGEDEALLASLTSAQEHSGRDSSGASRSR